MLSGTQGGAKDHIHAYILACTISKIILKAKSEYYLNRNNFFFYLIDVGSERAGRQARYWEASSIL